MQNVLQFSDIKPEQWHVTTPQDRSSGHGKQMWVNRSEDIKEKILFQLPATKAPFGVQPDGQDGNESTYKSTIMLDLTPDMVPVFADIDKLLLKHALQDKKLWFSKTMADEKIAAKQFPVVKPQSSPEWAPKIKVKIFKDGQKNATKIYKAVPNPDYGKVEGAEKLIAHRVTENEIPRGCQVTAVIEVGGAWVSQLGFGVELRAQQMFFEHKDFEPSIKDFNVAGGISLAKEEPNNATKNETTVVDDPSLKRSIDADGSDDVEGREASAAELPIPPAKIPKM
tara:strand:- start:22068 stop:22913 length:846 start_codon:yes stop_codon:yes gene_type:complete